MGVRLVDREVGRKINELELRFLITLKPDIFRQGSVSLGEALALNFAIPESVRDDIFRNETMKTSRKPTTKPTTESRIGESQ